MREDTAAILAQRVDEVALWCSVQELTAFHQDSPDETRRRELLKEANRLLATARYRGENASTVSTQRAALDTRHEFDTRDRPRLISTAGTSTAKLNTETNRFNRLQLFKRIETGDGQWGHRSSIDADQITTSPGTRYSSNSASRLSAALRSQRKCVGWSVKIRLERIL